MLDRLGRLGQNLLASQPDIPQLMIAERQQGTPVLRPLHGEQEAASGPPDEITDRPGEAFAGFRPLHWKFIVRTHSLSLPRQWRRPLLMQPFDPESREKASIERHKAIRWSSKSGFLCFVSSNFTKKIRAM